MAVQWGLEGGRSLLLAHHGYDEDAGSVACHGDGGDRREQRDPGGAGLEQRARGDCRE
jgi:hypothetical protein